LRKYDYLKNPKNKRLPVDFDDEEDYLRREVFSPTLDHSYRVIHLRF
jgi:hypothetical protein